MTVAELIEKLREMPPEAPVLAKDEEGRYEVSQVDLVKLRKDFGYPIPGNREKLISCVWVS